MQTMMNDVLMEMKLRWWRRQDIYQPLDSPPAGVKYKRDEYGKGPIGTSAVRLLGVGQSCSDATFTEARIASLLEEMLAGDGPCGVWSTEYLGEWINDIHVTQYEKLEISLFYMVALTVGSYPRLETPSLGAGEIDDLVFYLAASRG